MEYGKHHPSRYDAAYFDLPTAHQAVEDAKADIEQYKLDVSRHHGAEVVTAWTREDWARTNLHVKEKALARAEKRVEECRLHLAAQG